MRTAALFLLFAVRSSAVRKRSRAEEQGTVDDSANTSGALPHCGSCDELDSYLRWEAWKVISSKVGRSAIAVGHEGGQCCKMSNGLLDIPWDMFSAAKMVTAYTILMIIDQGLLTLDTRAADVLDWWTATDARKDVTLRHLLSQTSGVRNFFTYSLCWDVLLSDASNKTKICAKAAYDNHFPDSFRPGLEFTYAETTFYMAAAMALEVTGLEKWDDVYQAYLGAATGTNPVQCLFEGVAAGTGFLCDTENYGKILRAILAKTLFRDQTLHDEAERPHTLNAPPLCGPACQVKAQQVAGKPHPEPEAVVWHYGLGQWTECETQFCEGGVIRVSSPGFFGAYPWVDRGGFTGNKPHWGVMVRFWPVDSPRGIDGTAQIQEEVLPLAGKIVQ